MEAQSESAAPRNSAVRSSKLKYPLRSAGKVKEAPVPVPVPSAPKRVAKASADVSKSVSILDPSKKDKPSSSSSSNQGVVAKSFADVTKSVSILDLSKKDKPSPSTKRLSIPTKPNLTKPNGLLIKTPNSSRPNIPKTDTPVSNSRPNILKTDTPVSNSRPKIPKSDTPMSNVSVSNIARRKFSMICSVSYWMTQIKLAETASKHNISLGFFKLAFESGCEPLDRMKEELKTYIITHNLSPETSPPLTEILNLYDITEDLETLKISVPKKSESPSKTLISKTNPKTAPVSASAAKRNGNLKPRSLNSEANVNNGGSRVRVSNVKNAVKEKMIKKVKKEKREDNGEKENEICEDTLLVEESGSCDDITQKQELSEKEPNEIREIVPSAELSSEEEKENMVQVPLAEVSAVVLEA